MPKLKCAAASLMLIALGTGCSTTNSLIADRSVLLSPGLQLSHQALAGAAIAAAVVCYVVDPLAPTWRIEHRKLAADRYRIDLRQRRFAVGGDGEARQVFRRAAEKLAEDNGYPGYLVASYTEGIQSGPLLSQRVSRDVVLLTSAIGVAASR